MSSGAPKGSSERTLREILTPLVLEMYGLLEERPTQSVTPVRAPRVRPPSSPSNAPSRASFGRSLAPSNATGRFQREPQSVHPTRKGGFVKFGGPKGRSALGSRLPGESDADFADRRRRIAKAQRAGYAPPKREQATRSDFYREIGH
jgi:hypothetical protein